jgi:hypothetical protein
MRHALGIALPAVAILAGALSASTESHALYAGAASATVSPAPGAFIAGDARNRKFVGTHDDLFVKAAVISDGEQDIAVVVVDCIGLVRHEIQAIRERGAALAGRLSLPPERIIVASTHTHCGPDVVGIWGPDETTSGKDPVYIESLVQTAAEQVARACGALQPAKARSGALSSPMDWVENICEPGLLDTTMSVLQFRDERGASILTLTNFACHPTVMDGVTDQVSSDYVAGFYRVMGEAMGGEHIFLQGAIGGWVQPDKSGRGFALADRYGASVAARALEVLEFAKELEHGDIAFARKVFELPMENDGFLALSAAGVIELPATGKIETEVAWFRVGPVQFATHPGETSPAYSHQTRALMGTGPSFVLGLSLDALGYILKPEYFTESGYPHAEYLTGMSVGPKTGPAMMEALRRIIPARTQEGVQ